MEEEEDALLCTDDPGCLCLLWWWTSAANTSCPADIITSADRRAASFFLFLICMWRDRCDESDPGMTGNPCARVSSTEKLLYSLKMTLFLGGGEKSESESSWFSSSSTSMLTSSSSSVVVFCPPLPREDDLDSTPTQSLLRPFLPPLPFFVLPPLPSSGGGGGKSPLMSTWLSGLRGRPPPSRLVAELRDLNGLLLLLLLEAVGGGLRCRRKKLLSEGCWLLRPGCCCCRMEEVGVDMGEQPGSITSSTSLSTPLTPSPFALEVTNRSSSSSSSPSSAEPIL